MCGICGKISSKGVSREEILRMVSVLQHRGPDEEGIFVNQTIGFGHRRLSVIDLETGQQPMTIHDKKLWITFNGEIYNFKDLIRTDRNYNTTSDTEVLLHLYDEKGEKCLQYLSGMFAFAIYDERKRKLFLARDHLGQKPLYYFHDGETFAFASEIKSLLALEPKLREMDPNALYEYLTLRIITPPRSMFKNIRKLPPGHFLIFKEGKMNIERYWSPRYEPKIGLNFQDAVDELDQKVRSSVKNHLVSDVPVGALLSGGMDSTLIVSMMSQMSHEPIKTFSGEVPYEGYSELPYARAVARHYQTEHHELTIQPSLIHTLPKVVWHLDEPSDPLALCMYHLAELVRKKVKVVLGGDGGDELFGGYDRYYGNVMASYFALLPHSLRNAVIKLLMKILPENNWYRGLNHQLRWIQQMSSYSGSERYAKSLGYFYFLSSQYKNLYTGKFRKEIGLFDPGACIQDCFQSDNARDIVDKMLYTDTMLRMPDHPIMILDRMTMAHGLEARSPFLDHQLVEFCASLPSSFKVKGGQLRYIQNKLSTKYAPKVVMKRKKQGFSTPLTYILDKEFRLMYKTLLKQSRLVEKGYLDLNTINTLLNEHLSRNVDHGNRLWLLCNVEIWYRMMVEQESVEALTRSLNAN